MSKERSASMESEMQYINFVMDYPMLTEEKEEKLWKQVFAGGENAVSARDEIVLSYMKLVLSAAKKCSHTYGLNYSTKEGEADFFDIIQAGNEGLLEAVKKYNSKRAKFSTCAAFYIRIFINASIGQYTNTYLPKNVRSLAKKISKISREFYEKTYSEPNDLDILKNLKHEKTEISEYEFYARELRETLKREPSEQDIRNAAADLINKIQAIIYWDMSVSSLDAAVGEDGDSMYNSAKVTGIMEDEYEGLSDMDVPDFDLSSRELMALRLHDKDYCTNFISDKAVKALVKSFGIRKDEYENLYQRAMRKIIAHKSKGDEKYTFVNPLIEEAEITGYMKKTVNDMYSGFNGMFCREELQGQYDMMKESKENSTSAFVYWKEELCKNLRLSGFNVSGDSDKELSEAIEKLPKRTDFMKQIIDVMYNTFRSFPTSEVYLTRIIDRLGCEYINKSTSDNPDSIRVAIVKQFLATTDYGVYTETRNVKGEKKVTSFSVPKLIKKLNPELKTCADNDPRLISAVDENVFAKYDEMADPKQRKKWKLLKVADDLNEGVFKTNYATRTNLYLFAFAFGMKAFESKNAPDYDPVTDLEKNLFEDYYNNDYTKYLLEAAKNTYETEPSGEGINYKNFAELIYIYYLNREDLSAAERLKRAEGLISECFNYAVDNNKLSESPDEYSKTSVFKNDFWGLMSIDATDEVIREYVLKKCNIPKMVENNNKLFAASNSITALENTEQYLEKVNINAKIKGNSHTELSQYIKEQVENNPRYEDSEAFIKLIKEMTSLVDYKRLNTNAEGYKQSRTKLIVAAYYAFQYEVDPSGYSFAELFDTFASYADEDLVESRYQCVSEKNILDVYLVLIIYYAYNAL